MNCLRKIFLLRRLPARLCNLVIQVSRFKVKIFRFLLILCLPAFLLIPIPSYTFESKTYHLETGQKLFIPKDENGLINPWGYFHPQTILTHLDGYVDHVFGFVDLLTDVDFLESLCDEEAERLIDFVIFLVRFSVPKSRPDLAEKYEQEIEELLDLMYEDEGDEEEYKLSSNHDGHWEFVPAICYEKPEFILCKKKKKKKDKSWISRKWHHFTHWVDKHKEPVIAIGAVALGAIIAGVAGGSDPGNGTPSEYINKPGEVHFRDDPPEYSPPLTDVTPNDSISTLPSRDFQLPEQTVPISEPPQILEEAPLIVQESIEEVKEELVEENISEKATAKEFASYTTHRLLDEVSDYGLKHVVGEETIEAGHELIDRAFGTDYASEYTEESKEAIASLKEELGTDIALGVLPPPTTSVGAVARTGTAIGSAVVAQEVVAGASTTGGNLTKADAGPLSSQPTVMNDEYPIPMTAANDTIGWKVGDPINNRTGSGSVPTWSAVRHRYWKNEALNVKNGVTTRALEREVYEPTAENIKRMERGLAPQTFNEDLGKMESVELHHNPAQKDGGLFDVEPLTPEMHEKIDPHRNTGN